LHEKVKEFTYYRFTNMKGKKRFLPYYPKRYWALNYLFLDEVQKDSYIYLLQKLGFLSRNLTLLFTLLGCYGLPFGKNKGLY